jgi:hypothetical protein
MRLSSFMHRPCLWCPLSGHPISDGCEDHVDRLAVTGQREVDATDTLDPVVSADVRRCRQLGRARLHNSHSVIPDHAVRTSPGQVREATAGMIMTRTGCDARPGGVRNLEFLVVWAKLAG